MSDDKIKHGGKRDNAGRKATGVADTKVIRVDALLIPVVNEIKTLFKESGLVPSVTTIQEGDRNLQQTTFIPNDKEQVQTETIGRLQVDADELRKNYQVILNLNGQQKKEIAQLKEFGAPEVSKTEINKLKKIMADKEVAYHSIKGDKDAEIKRLKAKPPKCQAIKRNNEVCGKPATYEVKENKRLIHLCSVHHKPTTM